MIERVRTAEWPGDDHASYGVDVVFDELAAPPPATHARLGVAEIAPALNLVADVRDARSAPVEGHTSLRGRRDARTDAWVRLPHSGPTRRMFPQRAFRGSFDLASRRLTVDRWLRPTPFLPWELHRGLDFALLEAALDRALPHRPAGAAPSTPPRRRRAPRKRPRR